MNSNSEAQHQHNARITARLNPSNHTMEQGTVLGRMNCLSKGAASGFKVAIPGGGGGGIGQPLAKNESSRLRIHLYDVFNTYKVTADINHVDTCAVICGFIGPQQSENALTGMDPVIIPAGVPRKLGMTRNDFFNINAGIIKTLCEGIVKCCPRAIVKLITHPVNSTIPIAAEVIKKVGTFDPKKLLRVTMLHVVKANTFVAEVLALDPGDVDVLVVGGHATVTILPLLSHVKPQCSFTPDKVNNLNACIQNGSIGVEANDGSGYANLSMAHATIARLPRTRLKEEIENIVDHQIVSTRRGAYCITKAFLKSCRSEVRRHRGSSQKD
ncbi:Lactate/malate dehydrogenase, N-terminal [Dillenia turbinata]|uniref:malate dehydrogenase n=1 Tax=Dillenia turbinata TaxID=194707 RepID=A0AAN8UL72_9MAGN